MIVKRPKAELLASLFGRLEGISSPLSSTIGSFLLKFFRRGHPADDWPNHAVLTIRPFALRVLHVQREYRQLAFLAEVLCPHFYGEKTDQVVLTIRRLIPVPL